MNQISISVVKQMIGKSLKRFMVKRLLCSDFWRQSSRKKRDNEYLYDSCALCEDSGNVPGGSLFILHIINLVLHCLVLFVYHPST